jgi:hypothetical protein
MKKATLPMRAFGLPLLAVCIASAMFAAAPVEAKTLPKTINTHQLCNDPEMAVAVVSQMCANPKVRLAIAKELRQHSDFNDDYEMQHPSGGG